MQAVKLVAAGASHRSSPQALLSSMNLDAAGRTALAARIAATPGITGAVLLSTCNRLELYAAGDDPAALQTALREFSGATGISGDSGGSGFVFNDAQAVQHLMEVSAGIDSEMVGETEILGQVKQAYEAASAADRAGTVLHRLFQKSFQAAKMAREKSGIGHGQVSLGAVAAELARRIHGDLSQCRVLVVGSGQVGTDVARSLVLRGVRELVVSSRTLAHSEALATETGARSIPFAEWPDILPESGVAIFCTASPSVILTREALRSAMKKRRDEPLFILDLAMPPDVEAGPGELDGVFLYTFADLAAAANENRAGRMAEVDACRRMLAERAQSLWNDLERRGNQQPPREVEWPRFR
ncbi:MAG TPA: glutamyl-tRNA reductase [Opitutales bacterium]|nr:glutamyl-tRNA reductase [Opitutales bacterium]